MNDSDLFLPTGILTLQVFKRGELIEEWESLNLVLDTRRDIHAHLLGGDVTNMSVSRIGFGAGTAPADKGNTALTTPFVKALSGVTFPALANVVFAFVLAGSEANGLAISEFGLLTGLGVLYARKVRATPLVKTSDISLSGNWSINF